MQFYSGTFAVKNLCGDGTLIIGDYYNKKTEDSKVFVHDAKPFHLSEMKGYFLNEQLLSEVSNE